MSVLSSSHNQTLMLNIQEGIKHWQRNKILTGVVSHCLHHVCGTLSDDVRGVPEECDQITRQLFFVFHQLVHCVIRQPFHESHDSF